MRTLSLTHLADAVLLRDLDVLVAQDRVTTAALLAHIAEVDVRRLYLPAGHSSMFGYCVDHLHLSEGSAYKRIQAARAAREFPILFAALEEGRLHLSAICLLRPHLTAENVDELVSAATDLRKAEVEQLVARCFPAPDERTQPSILRALPARPTVQLSPGTVAVDAPRPELSPGTVASDPLPEPAPVAPTPASDPSYRLSLTMGQGMHDKLREFQALISHTVPSGDLAQVLERALDIALAQTKKSKCAATAKSKAAAKATTPKGRHIPAEVCRTVWNRDEGRCTFVGERGHRCEARQFIEYDHVLPVARGGKATVNGTRLLCRAHNQYEAERVFGQAFMSRKREEGRRATSIVGPEGDPREVGARVAHAPLRERPTLATTLAAR